MCIKWGLITVFLVSMYFIYDPFQYNLLLIIWYIEDQSYFFEFEFCNECRTTASNDSRRGGPKLMMINHAAIQWWKQNCVNTCVDTRKDDRLQKRVQVVICCLERHVDLTHHIGDGCSQYACSCSCHIYYDICGHGVLTCSCISPGKEIPLSYL